MRKLLIGEVATVTKAGYATVKIADPNSRLQLGYKVVDEAGREIGRLVDIIGRVEEPYAVIRVSDGQDLVGKRVFLVLPEKRRRRGRGRSKTRRGAGKSGRIRPRGRKEKVSRKRNTRPANRGKSLRGNRRGNR